MNISSINALTSLLNSQSTSDTTNTSSVNFQSYLSEALGNTTDVSALLENLNLSATDDVSSAYTQLLNEVQGTTSTADVNSLLSTIQGTTSATDASLLSNLQSPANSDYSSLLSGMDSTTADNYSTLLATLEGSNSNTDGTLVSGLASTSSDMLISSFQSDLFKNLNAAKAKLEGAYTDFAARIGENITQGQQLRMQEMQNNIAVISNYVNGNTAINSYTKAMQEKEE